jgi:hypothetical protein
MTMPWALRSSVSAFGDDLDVPEMPHSSGQSGKASKVLSQDRSRDVGYVRPSICALS